MSISHIYIPAISNGNNISKVDLFDYIPANRILNNGINVISNSEYLFVYVNIRKYVLLLDEYSPELLLENNLTKNFMNSIIPFMISEITSSEYKYPIFTNGLCVLYSKHKQEIYESDNKCYLSLIPRHYDSNEDTINKYSISLFNFYNNIYVNACIFLNICILMNFLLSTSDIVYNIFDFVCTDTEMKLDIYLDLNYILVFQSDKDVCEGILTGNNRPTIANNVGIINGLKYSLIFTNPATKTVTLKNFTTQYCSQENVCNEEIDFNNETGYKEVKCFNIDGIMKCFDNVIDAVESEYYENNLYETLYSVINKDKYYNSQQGALTYLYDIQFNTDYNVIISNTNIPQTLINNNPIITFFFNNLYMLLTINTTPDTDPDGKDFKKSSSKEDEQTGLSTTVWIIILIIVAIICIFGTFFIMKGINNGKPELQSKM